jgi:hypothetical protein
MVILKRREVFIFLTYEPYLLVLLRKTIKKLSQSKLLAVFVIYKSTVLGLTGFMDFVHRLEF